MRVVLMQTVEPASKIETTDILLKIFDGTYVKAVLKQVANNSTQMNAEEITQLIWLLKYFEDLFDGSLETQDTEPIGLD